MFSLLERALCLWIQVHPLWIQGLKRLALWTQNLTLLEDPGLWIQTIVLHCSCAKTASVREREDYGEGRGGVRELDRERGGERELRRENIETRGRVLEREQKMGGES